VLQHIQLVCKRDKAHSKCWHCHGAKEVARLQALLHYAKQKQGRDVSSAAGHQRICHSEEGDLTHSQGIRYTVMAKQAVTNHMSSTCCCSRCAVAVPSSDHVAVDRMPHVSLH
jgi:hypothetical protein